MLGGGSNLVVVDEGLDELVVNTEAMKQVTIGEDGVVTAEAGANLINTVVKCGRAGLQRPRERGGHSRVRRRRRGDERRAPTASRSAT